MSLRYAGSNQVKEIEAPDEDRLSELDCELRETYDLLFVNRSENAADYPAEPAQMQLFEAGGKRIGVDSDPLARCVSCNHRSICPNGDDRKGLPSLEKLQHEGRSWPITSSQKLQNRIDICGEVTGLLSPQSDDQGNIQIKCKLQQGVDRVEVKNCFFLNNSNTWRGILIGCKRR